MNSLNSVLIEGVLPNTAKVVVDEQTTACVCLFDIDSSYYVRDDDLFQEEKHRFSIVANGNLAKQCKGMLKEGQKVRIVGRLCGLNSKVTIEAEHIEFKPSFR